MMLSQCIPWDELVEGYYRSLSLTQGQIQRIRENFYLQYFVGLPIININNHSHPYCLWRYGGAWEKTAFMLLATIVNAEERRQTTFIDKDKCRKDDDPPNHDEVAFETLVHQGKLILDETVAEQAFRFSADLSLLRPSIFCLRCRIEA